MFYYITSLLKGESKQQQGPHRPTHYYITSLLKGESKQAINALGGIVNYITSLLKGESKREQVPVTTVFLLYHKSFKGGVKTLLVSYNP